MEIIKGKINKATKAVLYGPEGIGKTSLAAQFPDPLFIDTEGGTERFDVARLPRPTSWTMILEEVDYVKKNRCCSTLVIDTGDWAEKFCVQHVCDQNRWKSVETPGYGAGYRYVYEEFGKFLNSLSDVIELGINVVINCHAMMRKFEQPDEQGAYDRWELKLQSSAKCSISAMVKEWADMVLFCNYRTIVTNVGTEKAKDYKATGGQRVIYTTHSPVWDAKNREGLPDMVPMTYESIRSAIEGNMPSPTSVTAPAPSPAPAPVPDKSGFIPIPEQADDKIPFSEGEDPRIGDKVNIPGINMPAEVVEARYFSDASKIPKALRDLMEQNDVKESEVQIAVANKGYYPAGTLIQNMNQGFVQGVLIAAWPQVFEVIKEARKTGGNKF